MDSLGVYTHRAYRNACPCGTGGLCPVRHAEVSELADEQD